MSWYVADPSATPPSIANSGRGATSTRLRTAASPRRVMTRHVVSAALLTAGVEPSCVHDVEMALSEACTNAVQHAVEGMSYEVMVGISDEQVSIDVVDSGSGFGQRHVATDGHDHW